MNVILGFSRKSKAAAILNMKNAFNFIVKEGHNETNSNTLLTHITEVHLIGSIVVGVYQTNEFCLINKEKQYILIGWFSKEY